MSCFFSCEKPKSHKVPKILEQPKDLTVNIGDALASNSLSVVATNGNGDVLTYQWFISINDFDSTIIIHGATKDKYIPNKSIANTTEYYVTVSDSYYVVSSETALVIVVDTLSQ